MSGHDALRRPAWSSAAAALALVAACLVGCTRDAESPSTIDADRPPPVFGDPREGATDRLGPGRWVKARRGEEDAVETDDQRALVEKLETLGYLSGSRAAGGSGVTIHDRERAWQGLNFYTSGHGPEAVLADMDGNEIHRWRRALGEDWPDFPWLDHETFSYWRRAHLFENGDVLAIFEGAAMIKLDADSNLLWLSRGRQHHDMDVQADGRIYVLTRRPLVVPWLDPDARTLVDFVAVVDGNDGSLLEEVSLLDALRNSRYAHRIGERPEPLGDIFHTNSVFVVDDDFRVLRPEFADGDVVVSMNALGTFAVVDLDRGRATWVWSESRPGGLHDPDLVAGGRMLLFDNGTHKTGSRVIELDLVSERVSWSFANSAAHPLFSFCCGTVQRLGNGNTLITESDAGRALEVTNAGDIVWELHNPQRAGERSEFIATLFEVVRLPADFPTEWANGAERAAQSAK